MPYTSRLIAFQKLQIQRAEAGFIPTGGYSVVCDFYVQDPSDPTGEKTRRARLPYEAVSWLIKQLELQGTGQKDLASMDQSMQAQYAQTMLKQGVQPQQSFPPAGGQSMGTHPGAGLPMNHMAPGAAAPMHRM